MRFFRYSLWSVGCTIILISAIVGGTVRFNAVAEDAPVCAIIDASTIADAKDVCAKAGTGSSCYVSGTASAKTADDKGTFAKPGDSVDLTSVQSITTTTSDPKTGSSGVVLFKPNGGLPGDADAITAILFGDATIASKVNTTVATMPTLPVKTAGKDTILLRGGAGQNYPSILSLRASETQVADGRSKDGKWVRIRTQDGAGWALASLLDITGDVKTLTEMAEQDTHADFLYQTPMQSFTLSHETAADATNAKAACADLSSGLLLQIKTNKTARFLIDGTDIQFQDAALLIRATAKDRLEIAAITGNATVTALGTAITVHAGKWTRIRLGGADGLTPIAQPPQPTDYPFAIIDGTPINLLATDVTCTVGLPASSSKATVRVGPGEERGPIFFMTPDQNFQVLGKANDAKGQPWWKIDAASRKEAWIAQSDVHTVGVCNSIADVAAPPVIVAAPSGDENASTQDQGSTAEPASQGFAPTARSIWNAEPGPIQSSGACTSIPVAYCAQLVALTPQGNGFLWKGQELKPYYMARVRENVYAYAGPNILGDAQIKLTLVFTSATTFKATQSMVMNNEKGCTNTFTFGGTFLR